MRLWVTVWLLWTLGITPLHAAHFTSGAAAAVRYGTHEIALAGSPSENPFATEARVTFTPPSGRAGAVTVRAFYDGDSTWRARVYVTETGEWKWRSECRGDAALNGREGGFRAEPSDLAGMLRPHPQNPRAWATDDGQGFLNLSDTAYRLFHRDDAPLWREYIDDMARLGITCLRVASLGGWGGTPGAAVDNNDHWLGNEPWAGGANPDHARFDLAKFQATDARLAWLLDRHPRMQVQLILFGLKGYRSEATGKQWFALPERVRHAAMDTMIARWAAFPNVFWLVANDLHCDAAFPANQAFARDVGRYFAAHDLWRHLMSVGPNRRAGFPFASPADRDWCTYVHLEEGNAVGADAMVERGLDAVPRHIWMAEDYYEHDRGRFADAAYFYRWLFWSWTLAGGSANYGGRFGVMHPYSQTGRADLRWVGIDRVTDHTGHQLVGLDSLPVLASFFRERKIDPGRFVPDDARVADRDGREGKIRPKLARRGFDEWIVYHPNARPFESMPASAGKSAIRRDDLSEAHAAALDREKTARFSLNLSGTTGSWKARWLRASDGVSWDGGRLVAGGTVTMESPWPGCDVVLHLVRE